MEQNDISTENTGTENKNTENTGAENTGIASAEAENAAAQKNAGAREDDYQSIIAAQNAKVEQMFSICFLTPENASVERTEGGLLRARINGRDYPRIHPARCFPFTSPDEYISLREGTGNQSREIGMLRYINSLGEETAKIIKEQLDMIYFMPVIEHIKSIREEYGYSYWDTVTDRGEIRFTVTMGGNSIIKLSDVRLIITDLDGNRFEIPDTERLSGRELKMLDLYL